MGIITLLTDFGTQDEYVGVMKGVIFSRHPAATIVDITHHIDPQDVVQAAYTLRAAYGYFPEGTVHVAVVDPGVGGKRAIVAARGGGHFFLAPDNGILSLLDGVRFDTLIRVENTQYFRDTLSQTFHGRDIFAPVAAHMAAGGEIGRLGSPMDAGSLVKLSIGQPTLSDEGELTGTVISIDRFGNLITNIDANHIKQVLKAEEGNYSEVRIGEHRIAGLSRSYDSVRPRSPLAIVGSRGCLEISVNCGSAQDYFGVEKGAGVRVIPVATKDKGGR